MPKINSNKLPRLLGGATAIALLLSACSTVSTLDLEPGDCINLPDDTNVATGIELASVSQVSCSSEHEAQVYASVELDGEEMPSPEELQQRAIEFCEPAFEEFVGVPLARSSLDAFPLMPTKEGWERAGDRTLLCVAFSASPVTDTFKNSKL
ncbi:MAG: septum formation family protein [Actinomycetaceae bacterium]|nr:septum formation family protein [Actinomycetaceae bacterium]